MQHHHPWPSSSSSPQLGVPLPTAGQPSSTTPSPQYSPALPWWSWRTPQPVFLNHYHSHTPTCSRSQDDQRVSESGRSSQVVQILSGLGEPRATRDLGDVAGEDKAKAAGVRTEAAWSGVGEAAEEEEGGSASCRVPSFLIARPALPDLPPPPPAPRQSAAASAASPASASDMRRKPMKARRKTSSAEKAALLRIFEEDGNLYPSKEQRLAIAQQLRMSPRQVQVWFQNQRSKLAKAGGVTGHHHHLHLLTHLHRRSPSSSRLPAAPPTTQGHPTSTSLPFTASSSSSSSSSPISSSPPLTPPDSSSSSSLSFTSSSSSSSSSSLSSASGLTRQPMIAPILSSLQPPPPTAAHLAPPAPQQQPALVPYHQAVRAFEAKAQPQRQQEPLMVKEVAGGVTIEEDHNNDHFCQS